MMYIWLAALLFSASTLAASQASAQAVSQDQADASAASQAALSDEPAENAIVVTGIRSSLERAAEIKQNAVQVVDSIVAEDIGKLPDPTTAAALQPVPGVPVSNDRNNEDRKSDV